MKAQASKTPDTNLNPTEQVTPVIVKIGGDLTGTSDKALGSASGNNVISINSPTMPFDDKSGADWQEAWSSKAGRIHELTLKDGNLEQVFCAVTPAPDALTTFELIVGLQKFVIEEVQDPKGSDNFFMKIQSPVAFHAKDPSSSDSWTESKATLTGTPVKVTFKQTPTGTAGDNFKFEYLVNSTTLGFNLDFHITE